MEEIGRALSVQPNAAKHSVFRAVQKLRRALEPAMGWRDETLERGAAHAALLRRGDDAAPHLGLCPECRSE